MSINQSHSAESRDVTAESSERGISLIELALLLPLIIILIAGIVDYGFALKEIQTISSVAREGARIASSHSRRNRGVKCVDGGVPSSAIRCDTQNADELRITSSDPVVNAAKKSACQSLLNSELAPTDWDISANIQSGVEDGTEFDMVTVIVKKSPNAKTCLLCWDALLVALRGESQSTFTLESDCP